MWHPARSISIGYDDAPPWRDDGSSCAGDKIECPGGEQYFTKRAKALVAALRLEFTGIRIGGYCCRPNTAAPGKTSIHGTGRAVDIYSDPVTLSQVADWLVLHSYDLGVQYVIWDESFSGAGKSGPYGGPDPHKDHVHAEVISDNRSPGRTGVGSNGGLAAMAVLLFGILLAPQILRGIRL